MKRGITGGRGHHCGLWSPLQGPLVEEKNQKAAIGHGGLPFYPRLVVSMATTLATLVTLATLSSVTSVLPGSYVVLSILIHYKKGVLANFDIRSYFMKN